MQDFLNFIGFINDQLHTQRMPRLESLLMPASFSDIVSEFVASRLPAHCPDLVRNRHHNGRPDLLPKGFYADDAVLNGQEGIGSHLSRVRIWQPKIGHSQDVQPQADVRSQPVSRARAMPSCSQIGSIASERHSKSVNCSVRAARRGIALRLI
jgi:hypothetical protein